MLRATNQDVVVLTHIHTYMLCIQTEAHNKITTTKLCAHCEPRRAHQLHGVFTDSERARHVLRLENRCACVCLHISVLRYPVLLKDSKRALQSSAVELSLLRVGKCTSFREMGKSMRTRVYLCTRVHTVIHTRVRTSVTAGRQVGPAGCERSSAHNFIPS